MNPPRARSLRTALFAFFVLFARVALAQPTGAPPVPVESPPDEPAETHMTRGLELRRTGDDEHALVEFEQANALRPSARARAQIGLALYALGRWREAEDTLLPVVANDADPWVKDHAALLRESLATSQEHLAWLGVESNVAGAELFVNGVAIGTLPLPRPARVVAGIVVIEVHAQGYESARRTIEVAAGIRAREFITLVATPVVSPSAGGGVAAVVQAGASRRAVGWATVGAGVASAIEGAISLAVAGANRATYNDDAQCYFNGESRDQRCGVNRGVYDAATVTGVVALSLAALAVGVGTVLVVTSPPPGRQGATAGTVACGVGFGALGCQGRF